MGAMGRYIGSLSDEQRDRIITAQAWIDGGGSFVQRDGCRCLCGHAEDWFIDEEGEFGPTEFPRDRTASYNFMARVKGHGEQPVFNVYPLAVGRFGTARVVRAIRNRAAKLNGTDPQRIAQLLTTSNSTPLSRRT